MKKRFLSLLVLLFFFTLSLSAVSTTWFYDSLETNEQKALYDKIGSALLKAETGVYDIGDMKSDECLRIFSGYLDDHPGVFWVEPKITYRTYLENNKVKKCIEFTYTHTDSLEKDKRTFVYMVSKFSGYLQKDANDWIKLFHIYDYLASNIEYSLDYMDQSMWSVFFSGIGVCAGFARSFQYLALQEGIPAVVVHGRAIDSDVLHLWVMAQIDGKWYHFDPTWGLDDNDGNVDFTYFCRSQERIELTHVIDNDYPIPESGDDYYSYVRRRYRYFNTYDRDKFESVLLAALDNDEYSFTVEFASKSEMLKAKQDLTTGKGIEKIVQKDKLNISSYKISTSERACSMKLVFK